MPWTRSARPPDADALTDLAVRSVGMWGYDRAYLADARIELSVSADTIGRGSVVVAQVTAGPVGFYRLVFRRPRAWMTHLFVAPEHVGRGVGRRLWEHATTAAVAHHCPSLTIGADPNAEPFYRQMGARRTGRVTTSSGFRLSVMTIDLSGDDC